jgi:hypothetical protein
LPGRCDCGSGQFERSGSREREFGLRLSGQLAVPASGVTGFGAGAEGLVDNGLDGACTSSAFGTAAEAAINLLGIARKFFRGVDGVSNIVVAEHVAGTDNHENRKTLW